MITIEELLNRIKIDKVSTMKVDVEGLEYDMFNKLSEKTLRKIDQLLIEFHKGIVKTFTKKDM